MTTEEQKSNFNIFHILSAGDKELVHSSMIKFLLEEHSSFRENFLVDEYPELYIKLEISDTVSDNSRNKRLRFDLLGYDKPKDGKLLFAIENKFKATPSVHQLILYDRYFAEQKVLKNKNPSQKTAKRTPRKVILAEYFKKYLLVFSEGQIPSDVRKYCEDPSTKWEIRSFLSFKKVNSNLLSFLQNQTFESSLQNSKKILIKEYKEYLESIHEILNDYIESDKYYSYKILSEIKENPIFAPRFIVFQYLLHIQALISKSNLVKNWIDDPKIRMSSKNDGGKNIIPSIDFRIDNGIKFKYQQIRAISFGIDGDTIKISVFYDRDNKENKRELEQYLNEVKEKIKPDLDQLRCLKLNKEDGRNIKLKESEDSTKISVFSLFTFKPIDGKLKQDVVNDCANLLNMYFKYFTQ